MERTGCAVVAIAVWLLSAVSAAAVESWVKLPEPDLSGLEPAVAEQLRSVDASTRKRLEDETGAPATWAEAVGDLGRHYHAYQLSDAAEPCYRIARRLAPQDFRWPYFLGYLLQSTGKLAEAESAYLEALGIHRQAPTALLRLGEVYRDLGQTETAEELFQEALALDSSSAALQAALGELYVAQGRNDDAIRLLEMALESTPEATNLYYPLALAYRGRGDHEKARQLLSRRGPVGVKPADPFVDGLARLKAGERAYLLEGQTAFRAGRYEEAIIAFRKAVDATPDSVSARIDLGSALGQAGETEKALAEYERALELAPENSTALFNAGLLRAQRGELDVALEHLQSAARVAPEDVTIHLRLGDVLRIAGDPESALAQYRVAVVLDPSQEDARLGEAQVLASLGRFAEARDALDRGLTELPASGLMAHALSRLLAMGPDPSIRDGERALGLAERVFAAQPKPEYGEVVAAALAELGQCDEAVKWQRQVLEKSTNEALKVSRQRILVLYSKGPPCAYPVE